MGEERGGAGGLAGVVLVVRRDFLGGIFSLEGRGGGVEIFDEDRGSEGAEEWCCRPNLFFDEKRGQARRIEIGGWI